jgi:hypothetical protein
MSEQIAALDELFGLIYTDNERKSHGLYGKNFTDPSDLKALIECLERLINPGGQSSLLKVAYNRYQNDVGEVVAEPFSLAHVEDMVRYMIKLSTLPPVQQNEWASGRFPQYC